MRVITSKRVTDLEGRENPLFSHTTSILMYLLIFCATSRFSCAASKRVLELFFLLKSPEYHYTSVSYFSIIFRISSHFSFPFFHFSFLFPFLLFSFSFIFNLLPVLFLCMNLALGRLLRAIRHAQPPHALVATRSVHLDTTVSHCQLPRAHTRAACSPELATSGPCSLLALRPPCPIDLAPGTPSSSPETCA